MSEREADVRLRHMLDYAQEAVNLARGRTRNDLEQERLLELSLMQLATMIGEAANHVPPGRRTQLRTIPWPQIIGMRNRLVHGYDQIDRDILWPTVQQDLPPLIVALEEVLSLASE